MARYEFKWEDEDGGIFKRFSRSTPIEAWLVATDIDGGERLVTVVEMPRKDEATYEGILRSVLDAVNQTLRFTERPVVIVAAQEFAVRGTEPYLNA